MQSAGHANDAQCASYFSPKLGACHVEFPEFRIAAQAGLGQAAKIRVQRRCCSNVGRWVKFVVENVLFLTHPATSTVVNTVVFGARENELEIRARAQGGGEVLEHLNSFGGGFISKVQHRVLLQSRPPRNSYKTCPDTWGKYLSAQMSSEP
jgi:hypothetical protein